jgi:hypothetical protein
MLHDIYHYIGFLTALVCRIILFTAFEALTVGTVVVSQLPVLPDFTSGSFERWFWCSLILAYC